MPKKPDRTPLLAEEKPQTHAVITVGDMRLTESEKADREEVSKPLYLKRI
jgi:hypothetical protein